MVSLANLDAAWLFDSLIKLPFQNEIKTCWLAYSGGVDSQVLLHLLSCLKKSQGIDVRAVYIDHGLQSESKDWRQHCADSCLSLCIPFQSISVNAQPLQGESPEATARHARYKALENLIEDNDCLLTAQHQDDQAETFLLQLFRGAEAAGLASMPFYSAFSKGWHARPLLNASQQQLLDYAKQNDLHWVEDPSNRDCKFDRNLIRHTFIPKLKERWPSIDKTLSNAAHQQAENKQLIEQLAAEDLKKIETIETGLSIDDLKKLSEARCRNVLRFWIKQQGFNVAPRKILQQLLQQVFHAKNDAMPEIHWSNVVAHRFRNTLYVLFDVEHDATQTFQWQANDELRIESLNVQLKMSKTYEAGLSKEILNQTLHVCFRQGGEKIQPLGRNARHSLKKLFQEAGVPPWQREKIPLIYLQDELIAVAGYWVSESFKAENNEPAYFPNIIG